MLQQVPRLRLKDGRIILPEPEPEPEPGSSPTSSSTYATADVMTGSSLLDSGAGSSTDRLSPGPSTSPSSGRGVTALTETVSSAAAEAAGAQRNRSDTRPGAGRNETMMRARPRRRFEDSSSSDDDTLLHILHAGTGHLMPQTPPGLLFPPHVTPPPGAVTPPGTPLGPPPGTPPWGPGSRPPRTPDAPYWTPPYEDSPQALIETEIHGADEAAAHDSNDAVDDPDGARSRSRSRERISRLEE